jgi:formate--tetrahydrofolate ligase
MELAQLVCDTADANPVATPSFTYPDEASLMDKITAIAQKIYHAKDVSFAPQAVKDLTALEKEGYAACPVCIAKTQYSMSDNPALLGAPEGYTLTIRSARLSAGAGFVVAFAGSIIAMPGLPKVPAAMGIDVDDNGEIVGLF